MRRQQDAWVEVHQFLHVMVRNLLLVGKLVTHDLLFAGYDIGTVATQLTRLDARCDSGFVGQFTSGRVDQDRAWLHALDEVFIDQFVILPWEVRHVHGHDIAGREQFFCRDEFTVLLGKVGWIRVIGIDLAAKALPHLAFNGAP